MTAYIVNGIGRCGTTLMSTFLSNIYPFYGFVKNLHDIDNKSFKNNITIKTHSLNCFTQNRSDIKVLFMFGNIYNTVLSYKHKWSNNMLIHLFAEKNIGKNHLEEDIFQFDRYFKAWYKPSGFPVMFVRYEKLYDNLDTVLNFCNLNKQQIKKFPSYQPRQTQWNNYPQIDKEKIIKIYHKTQEIVDSLPDIKIFK